MNGLFKVVHTDGYTVHADERMLPVKNQRGKLYVNFQGKQINLKDIPEKKEALPDPVFDYIFGGLFQTHPVRLWTTGYYDTECSEI